MKDEALARKIDSVKTTIDDAKDLSPDEKEALHDLVDQAAATANGSQQKLDDLTVSHCKAVLRTARFELSFKDRVIDAIKEPLKDLKMELIDAVAQLLEDHKLNCPMNGKPAQPITLMDLAKTALANNMFYVAAAVIAFSPNVVELYKLWKQ